MPDQAATSDDARLHAELPHELDALLDLEVPQLRQLYEQADVPDLAALQGDLRGRMLATTVLPRTIDQIPRAFARSSVFPWRGKSFTPMGSDRGEGINRVFTDRFKKYRFETSIGPSHAGNFDALHLDYDLPENPFFIRAIADELRQLRPGLYLGQAYLRTSKGAKLVLYFGLTDH